MLPDAGTLRDYLSAICSILGRYMYNKINRRLLACTKGVRALLLKGSDPFNYPFNLRLLLIGVVSVMALSGCGNSNKPTSISPPSTTPAAMGCASYTNTGGDTLTATASPTTAAPNCIYETSFVDHGTPLTANLTLADLPDGGAHVFNGSLVVGADSATLAGVPDTPVVLTIEAGATIAFANAADRVIVNRGAQIEAVGTAADPITFTSLADVAALATTVTTDDLAATATDQWAGITINGAALNNACTYDALDAVAGTVPPRRGFAPDAPFTLADPQPDLTATTCSQGAAASGFHGGTSPADDSGELAFVIIKHVGDATANVNQNALHLRSVGSATTLSNIEVYSVDGSGIAIDGGGADLSAVLVYNPQEHGVLATGGYLGLLDGVLVSQADGAGNSCVQVDAGAGGTTQDQIDDGMNTRVTARTLTCDVSADNAGGAGVIVTEGARARLQNAIIVGTRVAAETAAPNDNVCLDLVGSRSIIEVDGVIAACLEAPASTALQVKVSGGRSTFSANNQFIATNTTIVATQEVLRDFQFHPPGASTTISPLARTNPSLVVLSDEGTLARRALFSSLLSASRVDGRATTVVSPGSAIIGTRTYLGAITTGNNLFSGWTFGVFGASPPLPLPPPPPAVACASYTNTAGVELTATAARTRAAPHCVYETTFVDNETPLTANLTLANLDAGGVHLFNGSLVVGADSATLAGVPGTAVVLTIEAGATIAFANAADRVIVNRGARIEAVGTAANPITFTSIADVDALASAATTDDLAATATDQWAGITINGAALNNACTYTGAAAGEPSRPFMTDAPFTLATQPDLATTCSQGAAVFTAGATAADAATLADGFHGGTSPADDSGELAYVIIKHVGDAAVDATTSAPVNRNALNLRSVGSATTLGNIEVYSVDGSGVRVDGGGANLSAVLVYNAQEHGVLATGGYLGLLDGVLVSQADGAGAACVQVVSGAGGDAADEITDGMNTRVTARNLTCDVSADNDDGAGVVVTEGAQARIQNAIIVGSRVAADATPTTDNVCLELVGDRSIIEADGVIASCLEASTVVTATSFLSVTSPADRVIATDMDADPTAEEVTTDIQFHDPASATTISPLAATDTQLVVLSDAGTLARRALFSLLLNASAINGSTPTVVASAAAGVPNRTYLGAITTANNPFSDWTFGVFGTPPPPPAVACASYTNTAGVELTATAARTRAAPHCVYETTFVDNETPLTANLTLANLDAGGVHLFNGSLVVGADSATLAGVPGTPVVLTIEAGATIAFANAADRVIVNRGARIEAVGTAANPITFTSLADVVALATTDPADDLADDAVNQWAGITINGAALNNACTYGGAAAGEPSRPFVTDAFTLADPQPTLTATTCSEGAAVLTADGFHGGTSPADDSGELAFVIIKHVGSAAASTNQNALHLRSVGSATTLSNIEVYSVDGSGVAIDGGGANLSNVLVYNAQEHGVLATGGYLGLLDGVLVSQADGAGLSCVQVNAGVGGMSATEITDGMNTRAAARNLTCDVSADNAGGAGVVVTEGARARLQNAIIVGTRVAAETTASNDNVCLDLVGSRSIIEVDGVIAACLEASASTALRARSISDYYIFSANNQFIATNTTIVRSQAVSRDFQFHPPGTATTISPLITTDNELILLSDEGTLGRRALFSLLLSASVVGHDPINGDIGPVAPVVVVSAVAGDPTRTYLGAISHRDFVRSNNPFDGWTFGVFGTPTTPPPPTPPPPPPSEPTVACASYREGGGGDERTAMAAPTLVAPNCVYETSFVDNGTPIEGGFSFGGFRETILALDKLDAGGVHVFNGSLIIGRHASLRIEAGATIAFANADDRVIINTDATIKAIGTAADPITFTSLADVETLATAATTDDLAAAATDQWAGITINGEAPNNACTYDALDAVAGTVPPRRGFAPNDPYTPVNQNLGLAARADCGLGAAVFTAGATTSDAPTLADGFHGAANPGDNSGEMTYVIIKHVGDAAAGTNRNALHLRSVGAGTTFDNIEVYSVDGSGIRIDGGGAELSNVLVYNAQEHGIDVTGGYLGVLDGVLVSQADGTGEACIQVDAGTGGETAAEITDGMNTRVTVRNLTCDVSTDNAGGAGVVVTEGARARIQNAIIAGTRVAADAAAANDNVCLDLVGTRSFIEADGVIVSCLEESVTFFDFVDNTGIGERIIATDAAAPTAVEVVLDVQFHDPGAATTISPLAATDPGLALLSAAGTLETRALFSSLLSASRVDGRATTVVSSAAAGVAANRTYLGAIAEGIGNNPFSIWTFGVFGTPPPPPTCASYTNSAGDTLTAMAARTREAPNCVYEASFVDNGTPLTASITLAYLDTGGVHVFNGSLVVGAESATLADVPDTPVVLTIEAGATIAFANAADRVIVNRGAQILAVGTAVDPITFTSIVDVDALASAATTDDLAATATDQWAGITINGAALNNACTYDALDAVSGTVPPRRGFEADAFTLVDPQPDLTASCSLGDAASSFHGGTSPDDDSGRLAYVIIKHVGDATASVNRNALNLRSVGAGTTFSNIEVYSVDGSGIRVDGGGADLSNVLVYNPQEHGIHVTGGYLGLLDGVLVSQADGTGEACVLVEGGVGGMSADEITDGMNTRAIVQSLTCDVSADNENGAGVIVLEGAFVLVQNAIIVGSRVAADATVATDNVCLDLVGDESILVVDGVIASCLEVSPVIDSADSFGPSGAPGAIPADATSIAGIALDIQFHDPGAATTISPLSTPDSALSVLSDAGTQGTRALFSLLLNASAVNLRATVPTAVASSAGVANRTYLGAIAEGVGNNPFFGWTFGVFTATPPSVTPPHPAVACGLYNTSTGDMLTATGVRTREAPNCVYGTSFVDNETPIPTIGFPGEDVVLANLDAGGVHVFEGSLIIDRGRRLIIEAGATIAFANADDRVIVNRGAEIMAVGTAADPITFTSLADVNALANDDPTDDLAADAVNEWGGITINGEAQNNACAYDVPASGGAQRIFETNDPFTLATQPNFLVSRCNLGGLVFTPGATPSDAAALADGFHGGEGVPINSGELAYVIIKHVGDATASVNRNALQLRSVDVGTKLSNIQVYSVDGSGILIDGGNADLSNVLVYNAQENGIRVTGSYLGVFDGVLVSQADGVGEACIQVDGGVGGTTAAEIADGMNTRVTVRNLTCDVSADNAGGAGVIVTEGARARIQNAIIAGTRVAADATVATDNVCLELVGSRSFIEADGVLSACLETSTVVTATNFAITNSSPGNRVIATDTTTSSLSQAAIDVQIFATLGTPISPLATTNPSLALLSAAGTQGTRALFSLLLNASAINFGGAVPTVVASSATASRTYLGAIAEGAGNNPFFGWTFGVFTATPPPVTPPPAVGCASYTNAGGDDLTAMAAPTAAAPNCIYEASFVDNATPLTTSLRLANLDAGGVHVFNGSLVVGADSATVAGIPAVAAVLIIEAGATIAFANAADRVIVNRGAQIEAVGTAADPITFTSLADVQALATTATTDDLAADAVNQWGGITINGQSQNNACTYEEAGLGAVRREFMDDDPYALESNRNLTLSADCSLGGPVVTADGFHGGRISRDNSGELAYVIIKHVGDAATGVNRNALHLRSVGDTTRLSNIEVYSVDGTGIRFDGGYHFNATAGPSNVLVYNAQEHGIHVTGGYLGVFDGVLVSQSDGVGNSCIQVDSGVGGMSAAEITDGMNTRVTARNLTCDVSADNAGGAGVIVTEGARARLQNAIISGSEVAADATVATDNVCLELVGSRSFIEADGVIASCLEASTVVTAANFLSADSPGDRVIAANAATPTADEVGMDVQFHAPGAATTISPLAGTDLGLALLYDVGTLESRTLFSLPLSASRVDAANTTVVSSGATASRTYLGAIAVGAGNNPFFGWTFGVFTATPPLPLPTVACASYTNAGGTMLTAAARTRAAPNCVYETNFVDNETPLTADITLANLDAEGVHVFSGSLVVGEGSPTLANVPTTAVVLTIEAGATIAFANAADRLIVNRGAQISAIGTAAAPITFTSLADVQALATADPADDLAATATDQWGGITINGEALNNACTYAVRDADAATGIVPPRRPLEANNFTPSSIPSLTVEGECSLGGPVVTADGYYGGASSRGESSGRLDFVIIKHVGDAATGVNRNALHLRSVGGGTNLRNIEVYSVDGTGIRIDGGFNTSGAVPYLANALIYNAQEHGIHATGGYLGVFDGVLVSQADGVGAACIQVDAGAGGMSAAEITDGMNTRVRVRNLTCDVSADNAGGAGVVVTEGARARVENAIIVGTRVAADATVATDNVCLELVGDRSIIEADGVIASCLEAATVVTAANFLSAATPGDRVIATNAATPTAVEVARDIQFHDPGAATTISPLAGTNTGLIVLSASGTADTRALFSLLLSGSTVNNATTTVVSSGATASRTYFGAITAGNNPFSAWTFGIFVAP